MSDPVGPEQTSVGVYHPLLGTNVEIRVTAHATDPDAAQAAAEAAEQAALAELVRLQSVFSVFDPASELSRWRRDATLAASPELVEVLAAAEHWWRLSGGAFHPAIAPLRTRWLQAAAEGQPPTGRELNEMANRLRALPFQVEDGRARQLGDCSGVDLNAIAKGYIVDRGLAAAEAAGATSVLINAGGDLRHRGSTPMRVGLEDPGSPGGAPLRVITLADGAVATSGPVHRGFQVADEWFGHVLDPRTGWPVTGRPSTTIKAPDAMTADALATLAGVLEWQSACRLMAELPGVAAIAIFTSGEVAEMGTW